MQETDFREKEEMQNMCATNTGSEHCCGDHRRRLELFCQEDEAFICVLCVPRHSCHSFVFLHEAVGMYKDKLKTSLSSLELKVRDLKDLQTKNETEFLEIQERAVNLEKYIAEEFVQLHQFLRDKEQKLIYQLNSKASEILKETEENLECIKTGSTEIHSAVSDINLEIKTEVEVLEERNDDTDYLTTTEESVSGDTSEHGKHKANGILSAPESFEDVAVTFSAEEMKMLTKQDKELHKEVMLENYETLVSAGYKIPPEALLVLLKEDNAELRVNDQEGINRTEHKNNFKEKPDSNGSRDWNIYWSHQPSLGVSVLHYPTENLQHSVQTLKGSDKHPVIPIAQLHPGNTCNMNAECDQSSVVQQCPLVRRRAHKEKKPYNCPEYNKCFGLRHNLVIHERTHVRERPYKCPECSKCFIERRALISHEMTHTGETPYKCSECNKCFRQRGALVIHERTHTGERPYKCPECNKCFRQRGALVRHERTHTGETPYKCPECNKCFRQRWNLVIHERTHMGERPYKCPECNKCFIERRALISHERTHTGETPYTCSECSKGFTTTSNLRRHLLVHKEKKPYTCPECSKGFTTTSSLRRHLLVHKEEKSFKCPECNKCFRQRGHLVTHEMTHTGERPYKCPECNRCFRQRGTLVIHERTHTGETPYKCPECNKCFRQRGTLVIHERTHTGGRQYKCPECNKCFRQRWTLVIHERTHTGEVN
ncbi:zinc finger protein 436-like isoform X2 [Protopterus annectens]|uniref:zinc finger protein 436-like isoform X2 n=1 Tax=Protopterus annectens TaxID=7888 RepID=UPI001CFB8452|nr:zinc finger protein 436-like isoform X2 [Protopterus annectens]